MKTKQGRPPQRSEFEDAVVHRILHRTNGRVQTLEVEVIGNRVIIRGITTSYHLKQLAIQSVIDVISANPGVTIEIDMQVSVVARLPDGDLGEQEGDQ